MSYQLEYRPPGPVARDFMVSDKFVRGLRGPIGSGKSGACCVELFRTFIAGQEPGLDGLRRSRGVIVRNTYAELRDTTMKTWVDWFPEEHFGAISMHPPPFVQNFAFNDVAAEILFMALDRPEDVKKLLSLELTWGWINEAREVPKPIVDALTGRLRRFPAKKDGGFTRSGLIMDTNSPDDLHWWPIMAGDVPPPEGMTAEEQLLLVKPSNWAFFTQPPAMLEQRNAAGEITGYEVNPSAENINNLDEDYYPGLITGKTRNWINVYVMNRIGVDFDGRKVHPHFVREIHVSPASLTPSEGHVLIVGVDFGLTPAAIFMQFVNGQWRVFYEIVLENAGADELADAINMAMAQRFPGFRAVIWGDPAGDARVGTNKDTPFQVLRAKGLVARPVASNDPELRRTSLANPLKRTHLGQPGLIISGPDCPILVKGLDGGWNYPRVRSAGGETYATEPAKNRYSHPCEAAEYGVMGGGEGARILGRGAGKSGVHNARVRDRDLFERLKTRRVNDRPRFGAPRV